MHRTAVIAGNYRQYLQWADDHGVNKSEYMYCPSPENLAGWHGHVKVVGEYWRSPAYHALKFRMTTEELANLEALGNSGTGGVFLDKEWDD
jgi:hypothetical protein